MNVIFMEDGTIAPDEMPPVIDFDMTNNYVTPITDNVADATFTTVTQSGPSVPSVTKTPFPYPTVAMGSATAVPVNHSRCKFPLNARLMLGNLSRVKSIHGKARCKALDGKTVCQALCMHYFVGGKYLPYKCSDLHYDVARGNLTVHIPPVDPPNPTPDAVVNSTFSTEPLVPVDQHVNGLPDTNSSEWFSDDAAYAIAQYADVDPLLEGETGQYS
jgi:hypothetical protein